MANRKRPVALGATICGLLLVLAGLGAPARAAADLPGPDFFGTNVQPMVVGTFEDPSVWPTFLTRQAGDGLAVARIDTGWAWVEPNPPSGGTHTYNWNNSSSRESLDLIVKDLAKSGVAPLAVISTPPWWAGNSSATVTPAHYPDLAAFAKALALRYGSNGSFWKQNPTVPKRPLEQYEIWTEANSTNSWTKGPNPQEYVDGLKDIYPAIHQGDPHAEVLASLGWQNAASYMATLYADGVKGLIDGIGFHPYSPTAPGIIDLVRQLRATLATNGDGGLPIYVTETGQPATTPENSNPQTDVDNFVPDQERGAALSLTGEALARSDCNVQDFLVYANVSSGTNAEPLHEGYMGIYDKTTAQPNLTGQALAAASTRWRASPADGLRICGSATTAPDKLLRLGLTGTTTPTCVAGNVTYHGNIIAGADLVLTTADGRRADQQSDVFGNNTVCIPNGPAIQTYQLHAEIPNIAVSDTLTCPVAYGTCGLNGTVTGPSDPPRTKLDPGVKAPACGFKLGFRLVRATTKGARLRGRLTCRGVKLAKVRASVYLLRKHHKRHLMRHVTLRRGRILTFTAHGKLRRKYRIELINPKKAARAIPRIAHMVTVKKFSRSLILKKKKTGKTA